MLKRTIGLTVVLATLSAGFVAMRGDDEKVTLAEVPPAVRATIQQHAQGATIKEIEKETKGGKTVFEVEIVRNGRTIEFQVAVDGRYLGVEDEDEKPVSLAQTPPAVQATIRKIVGANPIKELTQETDDGLVEYEVEYTVAGVSHSASIGANGHVLECERDVAAASIPQAVRAALAKRMPGATLREAEALQIHYYELEVKHNGKLYEVSVKPNGEIEDIDEESDGN